MRTGYKNTVVQNPNNLGTMDIHKHKETDCSNYGISSKYDEVIIWECYDKSAPDNAVVIERKHNQLRATTANRKGWAMFGGSFVYTCNGVVPHSGEAIKLFDRFETPEEMEYFSK